ncbi:uncharacterized protein LOC111379723 [Olea europaea var. sylvestris]|uniref:uncharacterized protein LOC111379723 n=1 Tax=Olea europaea var. sylvestris TaxID=158386 RepID=UPI000C1CD613|nr:uncharacterized protein LOC111379723 [Olea europaea var. sylvestris]
MTSARRIIRTEEKAQRVGETSNQLQVLSISLSEEQPREEILAAGINIDITFGTEDLEGIAFPHDDIWSYRPSSPTLKSRELKPVKTPLQGFGGGVITPEGIVGLPLTLGVEGKQVTQITTFEVVRTPMAYNAMLGRSLLNRIRAIVSTFHLAMKFPTTNGIGVVRGNQTVARQCYVTRVRKIKNVMQVIELEHENHGRLAPVEGLEEVEIEPRRKVTIGRGLDTAVMFELLSYLSRNLDVFAWNVEDMPGIDPEVAVHRLNVNPEARFVKQRKRQFALERREVIKDEIAKLVSAQFIREVQYPEWLANVVLVKKANEKCFLDAFSRYHQILMAKEDQEKTSVMADSAIYCYRVMPFGLKNAEASYQRLVNKIFTKLIGKTVKAYVDDMVVKSKQLDSHVSDLEEVFATLRRYNMKLNPAKCAFGVASRKLLGFMIIHRGIETNPDKIQALISMEAPKCKRDIQKLTGCVAALNKFVSRAVDRCFPFFKLLRRNRGFDWNEECNLAFQELK